MVWARGGQNGHINPKLTPWDGVRNCYRFADSAEAVEGESCEMRSQRNVEHDVQNERGLLPRAAKAQRRGQCTRREVKTTRLEEDCTSGGGPRGATCDRHGRRCHPSADPSDICLNLPMAALHTQTTDCATAAVQRQDSNEDMWVLRSAPRLGGSGHGSCV